MELKDLEIFQVVAETGTLTKAAKNLNYVQSNITARIQKLEEELATPLFNRHRRGMTLTPEGKKLLQYSKQILILTDEMKKAVQSKNEPSGKLEIGTIETVFQLPNILATFNKKYKQVELSLFSGVTGQLEQRVLEYELDGAFVSEADFSPSIIAEEAFEEELVLVSPYDTHPMEIIEDEPVLCFAEGCAYRARLKTWYEDQQIEPNKVMEFGTLETILRSVVAGLGIAFVPKSFVVDLEERKLLRTYALPGSYSKVKTMFIRREGTFLTNTMEKFIETVKSYQEIEVPTLRYGAAGLDSLPH